jgi:transposase-like protein
LKAGALWITWKTLKKVLKFKRYKCKACKRTFNDKTGIIFYSIGEYAKGDYHVNSCENKPSLFKPIEAIEKLLKEIIFLLFLLAIMRDA